ncbi:potassium channel family protein [Chondromyces apiculatus]|nr:potassium channel protein [Chondromyces apiculatus]
MKYLGIQLAFFLRQSQTKRNLAALGKLLAVVGVLVLVFTAIFHALMELEGQEHSWFTGFYWTLTVMTTLGFGDITFKTDLGRLFSMVVLLSGNVLLLILLPFAFIRFLYAPWLEAQLKLRAPRALPEGSAGHVVFCAWDAVTQGLSQKLGEAGVPYVVLVPDPVAAVQMMSDGVRVVTGEVDARATYDAVHAAEARAVVANLDDAQNTNVTLTVREVSATVPIVATVEHMESRDLLEFAGATHTMPLKHRLGQQLASRISLRSGEIHVVGRFRDVLMAELPALGTPLVGRSLRDLGLRQRTGVNVVGIWEHGRLAPARGDVPLTAASVPVLVGSEAQIEALRAEVPLGEAQAATVLIIGGGTVGRAAAAALVERGARVHLVEHEAAAAARCKEVAHEVMVGEAADRAVLERAGLGAASAVIVTTNDDAMNVYLSIYVRRLRADVRLVSRITHERNHEAILRAGADFVLSYASLGKEMMFSVLQGRELVLLGEGIDLHALPVPRALAGQSLAESDLGARTGLNVIAIQRGEEIEANPAPGAVLSRGEVLLVIGTQAQRSAFLEHYPERKGR